MIYQVRQIGISTAIIITVCLSLGFLLGCSSENTTSSSRTISLVIEDGNLEGENTVKANQNETVTFNIKSNQTGTLHIHGYDLEKDVTANHDAMFTMEATATGRFMIAFHSKTTGSEMEHGHSDQHHHEVDLTSHGAIFLSPGLHKKDSYSFTINEEYAGLTIPYHNHMDSSMFGTITVSEESNNGTRSITITDNSFEPSSISASPGTTILWENTSDSVVMIASGEHSVETEGHESHDHSDMEELELGYLEVAPN
ncbi:MAG: hypothetical protein CL896_01500 [Dehalococcoidia bacterium]|nr:hypothetical protein [Dehalococcoidia bacterium]